MKAIIAILAEKLKEIEAQWVALGIGIFALISLLCATSIVNNIIDMIIRIVEVITSGGVPQVTG